MRSPEEDHLATIKDAQFYEEEEEKEMVLLRGQIRAALPGRHCSEKHSNEPQVWQISGLFFRQLRPSNATTIALHAEYPWISPCQGEMNFVRAAVTPIVFCHLSDDHKLFYADSLHVPFRPEDLRIDMDSGNALPSSPAAQIFCPLSH